MNERKARMIELYADGYTLGDIAREYGISRQRVHQIIQGSYDTAHYGARRKAKREGEIFRSYELILAGDSTIQAEAERLGIKQNTLRGQFSEWGWRLTPPSPEHGTAYRYKRGCRCEECKAATRELKRKMKLRGPPQHGTESGYKNYGCRCEECKAAGAENNRRNRLARRERSTLVLPADD